MLVLRIDLDVGYVDNRALEDRPPCPEGPRWPHREYSTHLLEGFGGEVVLGDMAEQLAVELKERPEESVAQPHGASNDRVEDRLDVGLRLADHPEDLARRGLLLEGDSEIPVARLQLLEEADVLDGDDGLVGEGLEEGDLLLGEWALLHAANEKRPDGNTLTQQWRPKRSPDSERSKRGVGELRFERGTKIMQMDRLAVHDDPTCHGVAGERYHFSSAWESSLYSNPPKNITVEAKDHCVSRSTQARGILGYSIHHRLEVGRRAGDDVQDVAGGGLLLQRLGQVVVATFQLPEQPHVLDGDDGLIGKGLEQLELLVRERPDLRPEQENRPDWRTLAEQGGGDDGAVPQPALELAPNGELAFGLGSQVVDVDGAAFRHGAAGH